MLADLALIGFGNVGRRFARLLDERRDLLSHDYGLECRIVAIATRRHGAVCDASGIDALAAATRIESGEALDSDFRGNAIDVLSRSTAALRVLIETTTLDIESATAARQHVQLALEAGCHVVTANKGPAAFAYRELADLARRRAVMFLFEGAVMDGIPVFNLVRESMPTVAIESFRGVVNSTTNHILTAVEEGANYEAALARMQQAGIAEADPSLDVDGWDAAAKAAVLANVFLDARISPHDVDRTGIGPDIGEWARAATGRGCRVRLVASGVRGQQPVVRPVELPRDDLLAGLRNMANALILDTDTLGRVVISQLDGGLIHTAYALLSDLLTIRRQADRAR